MSLTELRTGLRDELAADLGIPAQDGYFEGRSERSDMLGVWIERTSDAENVLQEDVQLVVRYRKQYVVARNQQVPSDPTPLEQAAEALQVALRDKQANTFGVWMFRVSEIEFSYEDWGFDALVSAIRANPFASTA